ncbi:MAG: copper-translocating P-type ATPase [Gammaproteobacteria bacterium]|nr:copper-translocating P-type ATPase [Gammaproteobacteria bacterium]
MSSTEINIAVFGMSCSNCERKVESRIDQLAGVSSSKADFTQNSLCIRGTVLLDQIQEQILDLGYQLTEEVQAQEQPEPEVLSLGDVPGYNLSVSGMSCASCVRSVESALMASPGVLQATVNYAGGTAYVKSNGALDGLLVSLEDAGYPGRLQSDDLDEQDQRVKSDFSVAVRKSALALTAGMIFMLDMLIPIFPPLAEKPSWLIISALVLLIIWVSGGHFYRGALNAIKHGASTMDTLISLGTGSAWLYSTALIVAAEWFPEAARFHYFESALFINGFVNLGKAFEQSARGKASLAVNQLLRLKPESAQRVLPAGTVETVPIDSVVLGDTVRVTTGESVPLDGLVSSGRGEVNLAMLTGEFALEPVGSGDGVTGGTLLEAGSIDVCVERTGEQTTLAKMIELVRQAQNSKPPIAALVDEIAAWFVPVVVALACLTVAVWWQLADSTLLPYAFINGISVLIIACPCALGLAIPMSIMVGVGRAAGLGILLQNSSALQLAGKIDVVVVDKTGTLTRGSPEVENIQYEPGFGQGDLAVCHGLSVHSQHPLAKAISRYCISVGSAVVTVSQVNTEIGKGMTGSCGSTRVAMGSLQFLQELGMQTTGELLTSATGPMVYWGQDENILGVVHLEDELRESTREAVVDLQASGLQVIMLTGDHEAAARRIALELELDEFHHDMTPQGKFAFVQALQEKGNKVAMVGDGINDAAALSVADVSFAMGQGTDVSIQAADVTLLKNNLGSVIQLHQLSLQVVRNMWQNLSLAFGYNILLIPVAAGVLFPLFGLLIHPALAGFAMAISSVSVVLNALRLSRTS